MLYLFSDFELDDRALELRRGEQIVTIEPKPLRLLLDLLAHAPLLRSHEELRQVVWADEIVTSASLTRAVSALRRALGESAGASGLIETVRSRGYRMRGAVKRVAPGSGGQAAPAAWQEMFVGREGVLARLEALIASAESGRGAVALLAGEPGIGKTRTAEVLSERALSRGAEVYWGRCSETPVAPPYSPWSQMLRAYLEAHPGHDSLLNERRSSAGHLSELISERRELAGPRPLPNPPTDEARFALFESVTDFFRRAAAEGPILLVLEDLHWMDEPSLQLLSFLASHIGPMRLLVVGTYRSEAAAGGETLERILAELVSLPHVEPPLTLEGLSPSSVFSLLSAAVGEKSAPEVVDTIYDRTNGNPFFVRELTRQVAAAGGSEASLTEMPATVRQVLARRAGALEAPQRAILEAVAVVGHEAPLSLLAQVTGIRAPQALDILADLASANLLELSGGPAPRARFVHSLARQALYEGLHPSRRIQLHGAVAGALEKASSSHEQRTSEIAHHYIEAAPLLGIERALRYVRSAAEEALQRAAAKESVRLLERALELLELDPTVASLERCEILLALAASLDADGRRADAVERYAEAAQIARSEEASLHFAAATLGWTRHIPGYVVVGRWEVDAIAMLEEALDKLGDRDPSLRLELVAALLPKLYWAGDEGAIRADHLSRDAIEQARSGGSERLLALCLCRRHLLLWHPDGLEERMVLAREAIDLASSNVDPSVALEARFLRIVDLLEVGEVERAFEDVDFYEEMARENHRSSLVLQAQSWRNAWAHARAEISEAEDGIERGLQLARSAKVPTARYVLLVQQAIVDWTRNDLSSLDPALEAVADAHPSLGSWHALVAWLTTEIGDDARAKTHLEALNKLSTHPVSRSFDGLFVAAARAIAAARLNDAEAARPLYAQLLPYAQRHVVGVFGTVLLGSVSRYLGLLAGTLGYYDKAEHHFEEARGANWRTGASLWTAHTLCDHAEALLRRGESDDRRRAHRYLDEVRSLTDTSTALADLATRVRQIGHRLDGVSNLPRRPGVA